MAFCVMVTKVGLVMPFVIVMLPVFFQQLDGVGLDECQFALR